MITKRLARASVTWRRHLSRTEHDYVIIGAGSAGCVLTNRIAASGADVIVLEAGPKDSTWMIHMPAALMYCIKNPRYDWCYETTPQKALNDRVMYWPRGKVLGGSSSINAMVYVRGHPEDYNRWAKEGAIGWSFEHVLPYFKKAQSHSFGPDKYRGGDGPLGVTRGPMENPLFGAFNEAGKQAGYAYTDDSNGFRQEGFGPFDQTIRGGRRCSAAVAYLHPILKAKAENLKVCTDSLVHKLIHKSGRIIGVEYSRGSEKHVCTARKEVILCGGAINSPQLLLLSGIGPAEHLREHAIEVVLDQPKIGLNLQDHLEVYVQYKCKQPITLYKYQWKFPFNMVKTGLQWFYSQTGPAATTHLEAGAFIRSRPGIPHPDIQLHFLPGTVADHGKQMGEFHAFQAHAGTLRATSKGSVRLRSSNPADKPVLDPAYLSTNDDVIDMRNCVRLTREIFKQKAFDPFRSDEMTGDFDLSTDGGIDAFVRYRAESAYHPSCTLPMGSITDSHGRLIGIEGLRVVDASIMPSIVSGNLNATVVMMAEKIADAILGKTALPAAVGVPYWRADVAKQR